MDNLILVNKYYKLPEDYESEVELISTSYAYSGKYGVDFKLAVARSKMHVKSVFSYQIVIFKVII